MTQMQIAFRFGLHLMSVHKILKGHKWAHIFKELHGTG